MLSSLSASPILTIPVASSSLAPRRAGFRSRLIVTNSATAYKERSSAQGMAATATVCGSLYEVLRIPVGATNQEIKSAYRRLARTFHPDVAAVGRKDSSADEFMKIHAAYCTLSDPEKRAVYDSDLFKRRLNRQRPLTAAGFSGYTGRNWETDQCW
ncbi:hypothetical protein Tsubulata_045017 [Turnera subulata]|uniref:J domain-containing protein n=1 Tax=Turnera subulata TaxID=218843 RepID=A0A9Q0J295_9ROSI|nr:hypothetical protein Tsubulata_045017 [Turnera subulata]